MLQSSVIGTTISAGITNNNSNKVKYLLLILTILINLASAKCQINLLRYNDNFSYLKNDTLSKKGFERLKYIPISHRTTVSIGGEVREQLQHYQNINFGDIPPAFHTPDTWQLWQRIMAHGNIELNKHIRFFAQIGSTHRFFNHNPLTPEIDQNDLSIHQAFADFSHKNNWLLRLGRQELSYGNHRIFTFREGPNTRLTFDGAILKYKVRKRQIDLLVLSPVIAKKGAFDDETFKDMVAGFYVTEKIIPKFLNLDYYILTYSSSRRQYNFISGKENRQIAGWRLFSENTLANYEIEFTYQFGKFNGLQVKAFSISGDVNYLVVPDIKGVLGVSGNYVTGDKHKDDKQLNTYNLLFSKPQYGLTAPIGATNIVTLNPYIRINPVKKYFVLAGAHFLWRQSIQDGIYSPSALQIRPRPSLIYSTKEKQIGALLAVESNYTMNSHLSFSIDASVFTAGRYPRETGNGKNISYLSFKTIFRF